MKNKTLNGIILILIIALILIITQVVVVPNAETRGCLKNIAQDYCEDKDLEFIESGLITFICGKTERTTEEDGYKERFTGKEIEECRK